METGFKIDVELYNGPLDGHVAEVAMLAPGHNVYLFRTPREEGGLNVWAYEWADKTTAGGKRWVLNYLFRVARVGGDAKP